MELVSPNLRQNGIFFVISVGLLKEELNSQDLKSIIYKLGTEFTFVGALFTSEYNYSLVTISLNGYI
jgi:hypothetical protein